MKYTVPKKNLVKEFVIDRKRWFRGKEIGAELRNDEGLHCCIGFYAKACGYKSNDITGCVALDSLVDHAESKSHKNRDRYDDLKHIDYPERIRRLAESVGIYVDGIDDFFQDLYAINDDSSITEEEREAKITRRFAEKNVKVRFIN